MKDSWDKAFNVPIAVDKNANARSDQQQQNSPNQSEEQTSPQESEQPIKEDTNSKSASTEEGLKQHGLRNTVDIVDLQKEQKSNEEQKRASSAPPDTAPIDGKSTMNRPEQKRFTSKIEITPINPYEENSTSTSSNGNSGSSNAANSASDSKMSSNNNIREIPIQTSNPDNMGSPHMTRSRTSSGAREIPINTDRMQTHAPYDSPTMSRKQPQIRQIPIFVEGRKSPVMAKDIEEPVERKQFQQEQIPLKRKLDTNGGRASAPQPSNGQSQQKQQVPQDREIPVEQPSPAPHPPPPPPKPKDPMQRIQEVKEEVESLSNRIQQYTGKSRTDKEYLFLDEMLTRELIKLDTIEVEGNDMLRTARKDVIKNIQKSIALLESKVPAAVSGDAETQEKSVEGSSSQPPSAANADDSQTKEAAETKASGQK